MATKELLTIGKLDFLSHALFRSYVAMVLSSYDDVELCIILEATIKNANFKVM